MSDSGKYVVDGHYSGFGQNQLMNPQPTDAVLGSQEQGQECDPGSLCLGGIEGIKLALKTASIPKGVYLLNKAVSDYGEAGYSLFEAHSKNPESPWHWYKDYCAAYLKQKAIEELLKKVSLAAGQTLEKGNFNQFNQLIGRLSSPTAAVQVKISELVPQSTQKEE